MRTLKASEHEAVGVDIAKSTYTTMVGSIADRDAVREAMIGVEAVIHTATLHKPHIVTHTRQQFIDTNVTGTLNLLEEAVAAKVKAFVFTSTTSSFGDAMKPEPGGPATWITEQVVPIPKNIYGVTKLAAENLCALVHREHQLPCIILRTSRFFPEVDDQKGKRDAYPDQNLKANEFLYRRVDVADVVDAHLLAVNKAAELGFDRFIISATSPFQQDHLDALGTDAPPLVKQLFPHYEAIYDQLGWQMLPTFDRVYVNAHARDKLGWQPRYDFAHWLDSLAANRDPWSPLAQAIGSRGYHEGQTFDDGPYPV